MQLHWDCNEKLGRVTGLLECPLLSIIVYVGDEGAADTLQPRCNRAATPHAVGCSPKC